MLKPLARYDESKPVDPNSSLRDKIMKLLQQTTLTELTLDSGHTNAVTTHQSSVDYSVLAQLKHRLLQQENQVAQLSTDIQVLEKKTRTNAENNDMIKNTVSVLNGSDNTVKKRPIKRASTIYELHHSIHGGFHPMSQQDLTRFTDLSNSANFEAEDATIVELQNTASVAVAEQTEMTKRQTPANAADRAKQAFQEYGAAVTSPTQPSSFSMFTATNASPSVEQVIMEQQQQQQAQPRKQPQLSPDFYNEMKPAPEAEFSSNVKTLIRLVNELPEGVTKQTGACIIRLTMEAMGIAMEEVLGEGQNAQSELLENVRVNIKKIEEYKTVIRKLETDIKYFQGRANELSEIIDLFILSNASRNSITN
jgi:hypothetical protein